jgi:drug/metabolite transporter (DMT)-like permease
LTHDRIVRGVALLSVTVLVWGATFPIGKDAVTRLDPYWLGALRYAVVAPLFVALLWAVEGRQALRYEGKLGLAALVGCVGFGGFNLFTFGGMQYTAAAHAAIIMALQAPLTAIVHWLWRGVRPARPTIAFMTLALLGVLLVITKGDVAAAIAGGSMYGDALVFLGASSWVAYILGVVKFSGWSALRYTTLTCAPGAVALLAAAIGATALGVVAMPSVATVGPVGWQLAFLTFLTAFVGVLFWNNGIRLIGPLNAVLFGNLVPVITFAIRIAQGHRFSPIEITGATLVVCALAANNIYIRHMVTRRV